MKREPEPFVAQVCFLLECAGIVHPPGTKGETGCEQYTYPFLIVEDTPQEVRLWVTLLTDEPRLPSWSYIQQVLGTRDISSELVRGPSEWGDYLSIRKPGKEPL